MVQSLRLGTMLPALLVGILVSLFNVMLHCTSLMTLRRVFAVRHIRRLTYPQLGGVSATMAIVTSALMLAHFTEILIWSVIFATLRLAESWHAAIYDAFLSYTSLGFSLPAHHPWRLLEPISTLNGILLAGLSTAIMFEVLVRLMSQNTAPSRPS